MPLAAETSACRCIADPRAAEDQPNRFIVLDLSLATDARRLLILARGHLLSVEDRDRLEELIFFQHGPSETGASPRGRTSARKNRQVNQHSARVARPERVARPSVVFKWGLRRSLTEVALDDLDPTWKTCARALSAADERRTPARFSHPLFARLGVAVTRVLGTHCVSRLSRQLRRRDLCRARLFDAARAVHSDRGSGCRARPRDAGGARFGERRGDKPARAVWDHAGGARAPGFGDVFFCSTGR